MSELIRFLADGSLVIIIFIGSVILLRSVPVASWLDKYPLVIMAGLSSLLVGKLVSLIYQPSGARPFLESSVSAGAAYIDNPGFPSDHALLATVVVLAVYFMTNHPRLAFMLAFLTIIMCVARVLALVHTPLDVLGGVLLGVTGAIWYKQANQLRT